MLCVLAWDLCVCRLDVSVCNDTKRWNSDKCRWECKEMINKGRWDDWFIWNPSICECDCDKSCNVGEYLDYPNFKCRKKLIDKFVLEWEDEILNAIPLNKTDTISIAEKRVICKSNCLIYNISLAIICLLLLAIASIDSYYYYTRHGFKKEYSMLY